MEQIQIGPAGGNGGKPFDRYDIPVGGRLTAVHVYTDWVVNAIRFDYSDAAGAPGSRPPVGGLGGEHHVFYLDEDEYVTGISGRAGWYIDSIRLHTNKRVSPVYGGPGGDRDFLFEAPDGYEVSGLFGRSAWYIDSLGISARRRAEQPTPPTADAEATSSWLEAADEGRSLPASVVVRRASVADEAALDALEDAALAEAIAGLEGDEPAGEGTVDAAIYTQIVEDEAGGEAVAVVMAVAGATGGIETVGDEPNEAAVMVTDAIDSDDDMAALEEEAVEGAIEALLEETGDEPDEVEVTIYAGVSEGEGRRYGAVVAIATQTAAMPMAETGTRAAAAAPAREPRPKDLQLIEGIGPKIAELLVAHGIIDLATLATTPVERLREILGAAGRRFRLADPGSWPEQAALGAAGLWDALSELQTRLRGGRE